MCPAFVVDGIEDQVRQDVVIVPGDHGLFSTATPHCSVHVCERMQFLSVPARNWLHS